MKRGFIVALLCAGLAFAAASDKPSELKQVPKSEIAKLQETFKRFKQHDKEALCKFLLMDKL